MKTEREIARDLINGLRAAGFGYDDNVDDFMGTPYDTPTHEVSLGDMRIYEHEQGWTAERKMPDGNCEGFCDGTYEGALKKLIQFAVEKYPDRIQTDALS